MHAPQDPPLARPTEPQHDERLATPTVLAIGAIPLTGNVTPMPWYQHLRFAPDARERAAGRPGKPHLAAITILSDIVYWYRPRELREEATDEVIGYARRFAGTRLQRTYGYYVELFGLSYEQVRDAVAFLDAAGIIRKTVLKAVRLSTGAIAGNRLYVEPIPEAIGRISQPPGAAGEISPSGVEPTPSGLKPRAPGLKPRALGLKPRHVHENTTETSTEISSSSSSARGARRRDDEDDDADHTEIREEGSTKRRRAGEILALYGELTGNRLRADDEMVAEQLGAVRLSAIRRGIRLSIERSPEGPRSLRYCVGAIEEVAGARARHRTGAPRPDAQRPGAKSDGLGVPGVQASTSASGGRDEVAPEAEAAFAFRQRYLGAHGRQPTLEELRAYMAGWATEAGAEAALVEPSGRRLVLQGEAEPAMTARETKAEPAEASGGERCIGRARNAGKAGTNLV
jgi:hypothetical protein